MARQLEKIIAGPLSTIIVGVQSSEPVCFLVFIKDCIVLSCFVWMACKPCSALKGVDSSKSCNIFAKFMQYMHNSWVWFSLALYCKPSYTRGGRLGGGSTPVNHATNIGNNCVGLLLREASDNLGWFIAICEHTMQSIYTTRCLLQ